MKRKSMRKFREHGGQARVLAYISYRVIRPVLWLLLTLGSLFWLPIAMAAHDASYAHGAVMGVGYSPASMTTSNLPQSQVIFYDREFVKNLKANTPGLKCCERRELPAQSGNQHRLFMYNPLPANPLQTAEGTVGPPISVSVQNNTSTIGQYADYVNISDLAVQTAIDPALENIQRELAYRLALSINKLVLNTADGASAIDNAVSALSHNANVPFAKSDIINAVGHLTGRNVKPFHSGYLCGIIHPFIAADALNDASNNSLVDVLKRQPEGFEKLMELPSPDGDEVPVLDVGGVRFHQSTTVTQTSNYLSSGKTALRTYFFGQDGLIAISLGKKEGTELGEGEWSNLRLWLMRASEPSIGDQARVIGGWTAYNTKFVVTTPPDTTMRLAYIDAVSNVT